MTAPHIQRLIDRGVITEDADGTIRMTQSAHRVCFGVPVVHFIGFKDDRFTGAVKVFGYPDFIHRHWDYRAQCEVCEGDVAIFADGDETYEPTPWAYDDSARF